MLPLERVRPGAGGREGSEPLDWNLRNVYCIIVLMTVVKTLAGGCENVARMYCGYREIIHHVHLCNQILNDFIRF